MTTTSPLISICVPMFNEESNVKIFYERVCKVIQQETRYSFELLFTDNHSEDRTFEYLTELALKYPRVRVLRFSRNFGFQKSIITNYLNARGAAAI